jgi:hypothetical protein
VDEMAKTEDKVTAEAEVQGSEAEPEAKEEDQDSAT